MVIAAKYEDGVFKPLGKVEIEDGSIVQIYVPQEKKSKPRSIRDMGFAGMWEDREDIPDGQSYVNRLRDNPRS